MTLYFVGGDFDAVKIGRTNLPIKQRLGTLQSANYQTLELLAVCNGTEIIEGILHNFFEKDRIRGEWFRKTEAIVSLIEFIKAGGVPREWLKQYRARMKMSPMSDAVWKLTSKDMVL